jgi:protein-L-isoaspartate(D-aspartate) O-methyltransferase
MWGKWGRRDQEGLARLIESEHLSDPRIAEAFRRIAREDFVPEGARPEAYQDRPIAIPERQTTSQPSLIARMIDAAAPREDERVLEVGTGYGFQTALLAVLASEVFSIERHADLAEVAARNLERAGIETVEVLVGDGWLGHADGAPYDAIVVSAAAADVPAALGDQLAEGGRLVIPLSGMLGDEVWLLVKKGGRVERTRMITPARFVPLVQEPPDEP